ncbi:hypothetical protein [Xanthocytophaga agilis]|uniref:Uncharacterized protein n=1 Tax=Xanthocytophaga agilis TaxID=3048010 RepID=A0AAE3R114_9BACT|nr:hypothetical protein [Xanthocytophaga agilis]MDJ1499714.1 hypothetical protein [Xanthocytophaga agilis]
MKSIASLVLILLSFLLPAETQKNCTRECPCHTQQTCRSTTNDCNSLSALWKVVSRSQLYETRSEQNVISAFYSLFYPAFPLDDNGKFFHFSSRHKTPSLPLYLQYRKLII